MFNKKDEDRKLKKDQMDKLQLMLRERNITIEIHDIAYDKEKRIADDKDLAKKQQIVVQ
jgi:hypothetical protein